MNYRFITVLHNLKLDSMKNRGIEIFPGARISNGSQILEETLGTQIMKEVAGFHSINEFKDSTYFYSDGILGLEESIDYYNIKYTFYLLRLAQFLTHNLWEVKDNNVYVRDGFLIVYNNNFDDGYSYKASLSAIFTYSNLEKKESLFKDDELRSAISKYELILFSDFNDQGKWPQSDPLLKAMGSKRLDRALFFIVMARMMSILPIKILSYCTALECLFTIGSSEINHKISERTAILLGDTREKRIKIYTLIKTAYKYRSELIHGQYLKGTDDDLAAISMGLDDVLRQLISNRYNIFLKNDEEMEAIFLDLLFSDIPKGIDQK